MTRKRDGEKRFHWRELIVWRFVACLLVLCSSGCRTTALESWMVGQLELEAGNLDAAVSQLERSKKRDPEFAPAYLALAAACSKKGDFNAVSENLHAYLKLNPEHHIAHVYLAECLLTLDRSEEAKSHYLRYVQATRPENERESDRLAHCYERLARIAALEQNAFEENLYAGLTLYHQGQRARRVVGPDSADSEAAATRSNELFVRALERLQTAKADRPNDPQLRRSLATVLTALGEKGAAERLGVVEEVSSLSDPFSLSPKGQMATRDVDPLWPIESIKK